MGDSGKNIDLKCHYDFTERIVGPHRPCQFNHDMQPYTTYWHGLKCVSSHPYYIHFAHAHLHPYTNSWFEQTRAHTPIHTHIHTQALHTHTYTHKHYIHTPTHTHLHTQALHTHTYTHTYTHTHTHTHTHTRITSTNTNAYTRAFAFASVPNPANFDAVPARPDGWQDSCD